MMSQLRRLALSRQGLMPTKQFGSSLSGTRRAIEHLGYVQIDTLSVVERAHHHVLWSRVPGYKTTHLNQLIKKKHVFEYWYHAASYLPMRDYRFALLKMESIRNGEIRQYANVDKRLMKQIFARVKEEGPLRIRDLNKGAKVNKSKENSWHWGPGRLAVEKLFMQGDLMVCERNGMEKVYDLTERCLPEHIDTSMPTLTEYAFYLFDTTLRAHGVFTWKQLLHLKTGKPLKEAMRDVLNEHIRAGVIEPLDSGKKSSTYVNVKALKKLPTLDGTLKVLSPFDNVVIHRDRLSSLFEFDYRIECYVAASKRVYGYFCLPILYGDKFVGRIDCKAHRADRRLEVLSLHLEECRFDREEFFLALGCELNRFCEFNNCKFLDDDIIHKTSRR